MNGQKLFKTPVILISAAALLCLLSAPFIILLISDNPVADLENIRFSSPKTGEHFVRPVYNAAAYRWDVFLPCDPADNEVVISFDRFLNVAVGNSSYHSGERLEAVEEDTVYSLKTSLLIKNTAESRIAFHFADDLPAMYIDTSSGDMEHILRDESFREDSTFAVYDKDGTLDSAGTCGLKGHGFTSWKKYDKKSYNLRLDNSQSLLGLGAQKKWILLTNAADNTFLKNKTAFELSRRLGESYTPDSAFISLYLNGIYQGLYLLTQKIDVDEGTLALDDLDTWNQEHSSRVEPRFITSNTAEVYDQDGSLKQLELQEKYTDIPDDGSDISGGYFLGFEDAVRYQEAVSAFTTKNRYIVLRSPKYATKGEVEYIASLMRSAEEAILCDDPSDNSYLSFLDLDSWLRIYMIREFMVEYDADASSSYVYKKKGDDRLYSGPVWDFDRALWTVNDSDPSFSEQLLYIEGFKYWFNWHECSWLNRLSGKPRFQKELFRYYREAFAPVMFEIVQTCYPEWMRTIEHSARLDAIRWNNAPSDIEERFSDLTEWIERRTAFYNGYAEHPESYYKITYVTPDDRKNRCNLIYCVRRGEPLSCLPKLSVPVTAWVDEGGNAITSGSVPDSDMTLYPVLPGQ